MEENINLFKANELFQYKHISILKELFINPKYNHLSSDSKLLYGFILDRFTLSIKNNWKDENGYVYLIFTRKDIQKLFNLSDKTVTKAFKELVTCKLILEKKQGRNKPNLIYRCKMTCFDWSRKNSVSGNGGNTIQDTENLRCNYTNNNYPNRGNGKKNYTNFEQRNYKNFDFNSLIANQLI